MPAHVDLAIVGAGAAGLLLARRLSAGPWRSRAVLVIDDRAVDDSDRRWAYWAPGPEPLARHRWDRIEVTTPAASHVLDPSPYRYWQVTGEDLRASTRSRCARDAASFTFVDGHVEAIDDASDHAVLHTDGATVRARWVVDTALTKHGPPARMRLWFSGRLVQLDEPLAETSTATLIDLAEGRDGAFGFGYLLPYAPNAVFAQVTRFAAEHPARLEADFDRFVRRRLGHLRARPLPDEVEVASIPLRPRHPPRRVGRRVLVAGTPGGLVRASTGYGFVSMRADAEAVARSLERHEHPFDLPRAHGRHARLDAIMLEVMRSDPDAVAEAFERLFARNPTARVLRFLDGWTSPAEDAAVIATLPPGPFLRAAAGLRFRR